MADEPKYRRFKINGMKPSHGQFANEFLKRCDLGIEGTFVPEELVVRVTLTLDVTAEQLAKQPAKLVEAFTLQGWHNVTITELEVAD